MSFWKRLSKPTVDDPVLGTVRFEKGEWLGHVSIAGEPEPVMVAIDCGPEPPGSHERLALTTLVANLPQLSSLINQALLQLVQDHMVRAAETDPRLRDGHSLRAMVQLDGIFLSSRRPPELLYGFRGSYWPDAMLTLVVDGQTVRPVSLDD